MSQRSDEPMSQRSDEPTIPGNASQEHWPKLNLTVITERTRRLIATKNTTVAAELPKTVFKIPVVKRIADRLVYAGFYRRRCQAKTRKTRSPWKPYVRAEIHERDLTGRSAG